VTPALGSTHPHVSVVRLGSDCAADSPVADLIAELRRRHARVLVRRDVAVVRARGAALRNATRFAGSSTPTMRRAAPRAAAFAELGTLVRTPLVPGGSRSRTAPPERPRLGRPRRDAAS
jgi:hypothetical protein